MRNACVGGSQSQYAQEIMIFYKEISIETVHKTLYDGEYCAGMIYFKKKINTISWTLLKQI